MSVIIIGGGLAGLTAARTLQEKNISFQLLEATDRVGGRIKTDVIDGFRLDHGFQVLLQAYPETKRWLNYEQLQLRSFLPGAVLLKKNGKQDRIGDPLRDISSLFPTLRADAGNVFDKLRILRLRTRVNRQTIAEIFEQEERTTEAALSKEYNFAEGMIARFFSPFFSGIFLETELQTSRRMFDFVFKMFGEANAAVPNLGMEEIPKQLAAPLPPHSIKTHAKVERIDEQTVYLSDGTSLHADTIILATEATGLVSNYLPNIKTAYQSTTHLHFVAQTAPVKSPIIALNTLPNRLVNNICTISQVAEGYSPDKRQHLVSLSVVGSEEDQPTELEQAVRHELERWFGKDVQKWRHLHTRHVRYALPDQSQVQHEIDENNMKIRPGLYVCGDHLLNGSINAAMRSGRLVAEQVSQL
ncbi:MAG: NAD(P)/FAD-dependent oxidoreductase [Bacteroidota bacterium]